jgi:hypothetical protein
MRELEEMIKRSHENASELEEIFNLSAFRVRFNPDDICFNGKPRCQEYQNDSEDMSFGSQCNLRKDHDQEHMFGICGMLAETGNDNEPKCIDDDHVGTCSVCLVREVRSN